MKFRCVCNVFFLFLLFSIVQPISYIIFNVIIINDSKLSMLLCYFINFFQKKCYSNNIYIKKRAIKKNSHVTMPFGSWLVVCLAAQSQILLRSYIDFLFPSLVNTIINICGNTSSCWQIIKAGNKKEEKKLLDPAIDQSSCGFDSYLWQRVEVKDCNF